MKERKRHGIQAAAALLTNGNVKGFFTGTIWQGSSKTFCVPGLNCYSCPGALGSCPIGSLQVALSGYKKDVPYYIIGTLMLFGIAFGRVICGFLCPFGFLQDLLYKIKVKKFTVPARADQKLRYLKYLILIVFVIALPLLITGAFGVGDPWFCKYICPAGTIEGGVPLVIANEAVRSMVGLLFSWKMLLLLLFLAASTFIYRPFCKYICPLGAIYGLFNNFSFFRMEVDKGKCISCNTCAKVCKMNVPVLQNINSAECIRCGVCREACPTGAISLCKGFNVKVITDGGEK